MKKIVIVYWSGTGNTEMMAEALGEGAREAGASVQLKEVADATKEDILNADAVAFGCPSMGDEVLEEMEMEPFIESLTEEDLKDKPLILFGSYDWGDGQWMREWEERMKNCGANLLMDGLIIQNTPDQDQLNQYHLIGKNLASS